MPACGNRRASGAVSELTRAERARPEAGCGLHTVTVRLAPMDLEEKTLEELGDHCEECGAKLTPEELQAAMESGGPALCSIHAAEDEPGLAADEAGFVDAE
jgi:hypothetical protein